MFMPSFDERSYSSAKPLMMRGMTPPGFTPPPSVPATAESFMPVRKPPLTSQKATLKSKRPVPLQAAWPAKVSELSS